MVTIDDIVVASVICWLDDERPGVIVRRGFYARGNLVDDLGPDIPNW